MALLTFYTVQVQRIIAHAKAAPEHEMGWTNHRPQPAVTLAGDRGVYLMSNGMPRDQLTPDKPGNYVAHASGMNPNIDPDWYEAKRRVYGGDNGADCLLIIDELQLLIDRGEETIKLEIAEDHIGVLMPDVSWINTGVMVKTPSGLGGVFHARVLSVTDTHASLQNQGNSEDFDKAPPYLVPLGKVRPVKTTEDA